MPIELSQLNLHGVEGGVYMNPQAPDRHTIFVPGWGQTTELSARTVSSLTSLSKYSYFYGHMYKHNQQSALQRVIESVESNEIYLVSHSEGSVFAARAACKNIEKIKSIIFINPSSLANRSRFAAVIAGGRQYLIDSKKASYSPEFKARHELRFEELKRHIKQHRLRSILSASKAIKITIKDELSDLHSASVELHAICAKDDLLFPPNSVSKAVRNCFDTFDIVEGWHDDFHYNSGKYVELLAQRL